MQGLTVTEHALFYPDEYLERVTAFLAEASGWCKKHGLSVETGVVTLREERMAEYEAPSLCIAKDGVSVAKIVPVGSKIIGARGRVDLIGRVARHAFLFHVGKGPGISTETVSGRKSIGSSPTPMLAGVNGDGWYWIEATVRRPKRIDEGLFIDLLTDVSDYEFE
ncbi:hypothetical protein B0G57_116107 [Trinickia symbiotica]|uniref:hypothetical protein n=1 Tax=Trinickia symbiotica TaxID=863227 RepID=UPI000D41FAC6|nr:hypothetical protein [Trinickia symbiotica]PPK42856.1 hypothetical protein B0G57_116107 [Trinickia symbiotica]